MQDVKIGSFYYFRISLNMWLVILCVLITHAYHLLLEVEKMPKFWGYDL